MCVENDLNMNLDKLEHALYTSGTIHGSKSDFTRPKPILVDPRVFPSLNKMSHNPCNIQNRTKTHPTPQNPYTTLRIILYHIYSLNPD